MSGLQSAQWKTLWCWVFGARSGALSALGNEKRLGADGGKNKNTNYLVTGREVQFGAEGWKVGSKLMEEQRHFDIYPVMLKLSAHDYKGEQFSAV